MKFYLLKAQLMLPTFTEMNLEPGTYEAKIFPMFDIVRTIQQNRHWLTFYFFNRICFQIVWDKACKMCDV